MSIDLDLEKDFAAVADHLEPVTLRRRGSIETVAIETACREQAVTQEAEPSGGGALQSDLVWHLQLPDGVPAAEPGDVIIDGQKNRWTLLRVERSAQLSRTKCFTRELRIAHGCIDHVDVERAVWDDLGSGPEIVDWFYVSMAVSVKIQLDELLLDTSTDPPTKQLLFDVILGDAVPLEPDDRLTAEDGASYRVQAVQQAERIDALPIAKAVREEVG